MTTTVPIQLPKFPPPLHSPATHFAYLRRPASLKSNWVKESTFTQRRRDSRVSSVGREDIEFPVLEEDYNDGEDDEEEEEDVPPTPQDLEYIGEIKRVLELLKKNRDMLFNEVKLTIMIEDPREEERKKLFGIDDPDAPTRDELADALELVNEGKVPKDRLALRMLADEMTNWPNLEVEVSNKAKPTKSLYARVTNTGIDPKEAAKRLKLDFDSAAEFEDTALDSDDTEVPSVLGYGALYLVTGFPVLLVKAGLNEVNSPVLAAFVFEKELKGALKRGSTARAAVHRKSQECSSARKVRFSSSSSSPSSASSLSSPARMEFNAFLDAEARA
ncbi:Ycf3-interacting protein 1, chloroplastic [Linum perenne]